MVSSGCPHLHPDECFLGTPCQNLLQPVSRLNQHHSGQKEGGMTGMPEQHRQMSQEHGPSTAQDPPLPVSEVTALTLPGGDTVEPQLACVPGTTARAQICFWMSRLQPTVSTKLPSSPGLFGFGPHSTQAQLRGCWVIPAGKSTSSFNSSVNFYFLSFKVLLLHRDRN